MLDEFELKTFANEVETTLAIAFRPSFINSVVNDDYIHLVIACSHFRHLTIAERSALVFAKLKIHDPEILEKATIIVETYTTSEIEDFIEFSLMM